jgi:hypothetical protein
MCRAGTQADGTCNSRQLDEIRGLKFEIVSAPRDEFRSDERPLLRRCVRDSYMTSAELIDCRSLVRGSLIEVETKSRRYHIECLGGNEIRISGHPEYCPDPVPAQLHGSVNEEGRVELGLIGRGMRLIFLLNECLPVTTSTVLHVQVGQPESFQPKSSPSIH